MKIKLLIEGGDMKPGPSVAQQLGPIGVNMGKVIADVNQATKEFKGMKVPVELNIDEKTKSFIVHTFSPPTSELLKKELNVEKGSAKISEIKIGNMSIEDVIKIAKIKHSNMLEKELKSAVKSVLGTCASLGILVEDENPIEIIARINDGAFSNEIEEGIAETSAPKRQNLKNYFDKIKSAQDIKIAQEKAAEKSAEEAVEKSAEETKTTKPESKKEKTKK